VIGQRVWLHNLRRTARRFCAQAGYGNVSESSVATVYDDHITDIPKAVTEDFTSLEQTCPDKPNTKTPANVKTARKKMRQGDQDAIRDYTASID